VGDEGLAKRLRRKGISDDRVLEAVARLHRRAFVPPQHGDEASGDYPLPIGFGQTISQPYVVAYMTEALKLTGRERVLEIGTGSGYQTALLAQLAAEVFSIEFLPELSRAAAARLRTLGFDRVQLREGDGALGWPEAAPFDAILLTAAPDRLPAPLIEQLAPGGRLLAPIGATPSQELVRFDKLEDGTLRSESLLPVRFVPMARGLEGQAAHPARSLS
jgi:protein-L-isoaspartate(D-aspartate) O-methyltransferase